MMMRAVNVAVLVPSGPATNVAFSTLMGPTVAWTPLPEFMLACIMVVEPGPFQQPARSVLERAANATRAAVRERITAQD